MMRVIAVFLTGCFSWSQVDAPPRNRWHEPQHTCDPNSRAPIGAAVVTVATGGMATALFATTEREGLDDIEERSWGLILGIVSVAYLLDGMNAWSDRSACRAYRRALASPKAIDLR